MSQVSFNLESANIDAINRMLDSSTVSIGWTGTRYLSGDFGDIVMDRVIEKLDSISQRTEPFGEVEINRGLECSRKLKNFYHQSDDQLSQASEQCFGKIWSVFVNVISGIHAFVHFFTAFNAPTPRNLVEWGPMGAMQSVDRPGGIENNFYSRAEASQIHRTPPDIYMELRDIIHS